MPFAYSICNFISLKSAVTSYSTAIHSQLLYISIKSAGYSETSEGSKWMVPSRYIVLPLSGSVTFHSGGSISLVEIYSLISAVLPKGFSFVSVFDSSLSSSLLSSEFSVISLDASSFDWVFTVSEDGSSLSFPHAVTQKQRIVVMISNTSFFFICAPPK